MAMMQAAHAHRMKSLAQMNGDFLVCLRKPITSEYRADVRGHNAAGAQACRKQLGLWYKEQHLVLDKITRAQRQVYRTMVKAHLNKKRIRLERLKEERMLSEEQKNDDGQKKSQAVGKTKASENERQPANTINENGNSSENQGKKQELNEKEQKTRVTDLESDHKKTNKNVNEKEDGNSKADQNNDVTGSPEVEQKNYVTSGDSNLNRLTTTVTTTTVDPKTDQCLLNSTDYYLPIIAREQKIKYKGLITIKEDPSPLNDKTSNNGVSVKTHSEKNYQDLRSNLRDDESVKRNDDIGDENFKGGDRRQRVTTGVKLEPVRQRKARVLEVRKDTRAEPRVRERSSEQLITDSSEQLNEKRKETSDDNHSGILTNPLHDVVTRKAQSNEACVIPSMTEDPNNRTVYVLTSLSRPKQSDRSGRQTGLIALSVTRRHKANKPKSLRPIVPLPAITENEERGPLRKQLQDKDNEDRDVKNMRELTQPLKDGQNVKIDAQRNASSFLPPIKLTNGKLEKRSDVNVIQDDNVLPRLSRSLDFVPGYLEHDDDIKTTTGSTQSLTAVELNSLRRKRERKMRKKILDEETVTVYQKNSKGQVVPSGIPFRRNVFSPPRDHEGRIRKRLVEAEQSVARQQKERMNTFFTQMVETGYLIEKKKPEVQVAPPPEENEKNKKNKKGGKLPPLPGGGVGGSLGALMTVFRQDYSSGTPPSREGTYENLRRCRYLRERDYKDGGQKDTLKT